MATSDLLTTERLNATQIEEMDIDFNIFRQLHYQLQQFHVNADAIEKQRVIIAGLSEFVQNQSLKELLLSGDVDFMDFTDRDSSDSEVWFNHWSTKNGYNIRYGDYIDGGSQWFQVNSFIVLLLQVISAKYQINFVYDEIRGSEFDINVLDQLQRESSDTGSDQASSVSWDCTNFLGELRKKQEKLDADAYKKIVDEKVYGPRSKVMMVKKDDEPGYNYLLVKDRSIQELIKDKDFWAYCLSYANRKNLLSTERYNIKLTDKEMRTINSRYSVDKVQAVIDQTIKNKRAKQLVEEVRNEIKKTYERRYKESANNDENDQEELRDVNDIGSEHKHEKQEEKKIKDIMEGKELKCTGTNTSTYTPAEKDRIFGTASNDKDIQDDERLNESECCEEDDSIKKALGILGANEKLIKMYAKDTRSIANILNIGLSRNFQVPSDDIGIVIHKLEKDDLNGGDRLILTISLRDGNITIDPQYVVESFIKDDAIDRRYNKLKMDKYMRRRAMRILTLKGRCGADTDNWYTQPIMEDYTEYDITMTLTDVLKYINPSLGIRNDYPIEFTDMVIDNDLPQARADLITINFENIIKSIISTYMVTTSVIYELVKAYNILQERLLLVDYEGVGSRKTNNVLKDNKQCTEENNKYINADQGRITFNKTNELAVIIRALRDACILSQKDSMPVDNGKGMLDSVIAKLLNWNYYEVNQCDITIVFTGVTLAMKVRNPRANTKQLLRRMDFTGHVSMSRTQIINFVQSLPWFSILLNIVRGINSEDFIKVKNIIGYWLILLYSRDISVMKSIEPRFLPGYTETDNDGVELTMNQFSLLHDAHLKHYQAHWMEDEDVIELAPKDYKYEKWIYNLTSYQDILMLKYTDVNYQFTNFITLLLSMLLL